MKIIFLALGCALLLFPSALWAKNSFSNLSLEEWISFQEKSSEKFLVANISPAGTRAGIVVASPQRENPDYFFHWVRDAALVMEVVRERSLLGGRDDWERHLHEFAYFSRLNQLSSALTGLGEPKFHVNGAPYHGPWARPQNDGPALRASVLSRWALDLLDQGEANFVRAWLYNPELPANTVIKADLEYISYHWQETSFDLWEEVRADHFYTRLTQWRAFLDGARLADRLGDVGAALWYRRQAGQIARLLDSHWNEQRQQLDASLNFAEGVHYKDSGLDIAVILGVLHASTPDFFPASDGRVQATFARLERAFAGLYAVNQNRALGTALGRYPEDKYAGDNFDGGNPWVLTTLAGAEFKYRLAEEAWSVAEAEKYLAEGDRFLERVKYHAGPEGSLSEQIDRHSGFMVSARDLTWSYAAFLTAKWQRDRAVQGMKRQSRGKK